MIGDAVRDHFARKASLSLRDLRRLRRRGLLSLAIGTAFLAVVFGLSQLVARFAGEVSIARLFREGLLIVGWVAMWRPLEIFLYDWWPILGDKRIYDRLSQIPVRVVCSGNADTDRLVQLLAEGKAQTSPRDFDQRAAVRAIARWENEGGAGGQRAPPLKSHRKAPTKRLKSAKGAIAQIVQSRSIQGRPSDGTYSEGSHAFRRTLMIHWTLNLSKRGRGRGTFARPST